MDEVVSAGVVLVVPAAVVDRGSGARRRRRGAAGLASVDHETLKPPRLSKESDVNFTCIYPILDV